LTYAHTPTANILTINKEPSEQHYKSRSKVNESTQQQIKKRRADQHTIDNTTIKSTDNTMIELS